jgi:plasmid stabilization system protein ParE
MAYRSSFRLARPLSLAVAGCVATLLLSGCSDPSVTAQSKFGQDLTAIAEEYGKALGGRPDLLSAAPSDEGLAALRALGDRARGLSGGSSTQEESARALAASIYRTAGAIALARAAGIESQHEVVRGIAIAADSLADDLDAIASAGANLALDASRSEAQDARNGASQSARALQTAIASLDKPLGAATNRMSEAAARLAALDMENAVLLRKARESSPAVALTFVEESAKLQAEARSTRTAMSNDAIDAGALTTDRGLAEQGLTAAQSLQAAAGKALEMLGAFEGDVASNVEKSAEMAKALRAQADSLLKGIADERAGVLRASYDAAAEDLAKSNPNGSLAYAVMTDELRLKLVELNGLGAQGRSLMIMLGDGAPGLADLKASAEAGITALKEKATAAADQMANAGEDPTLASIKTFVDEVKKNADGLTVDTLMAPPAPAAKPKAAAKSSGRSMSGGASGAPGASESLESIVEQMNAAAGDSARSTELLGMYVDDSKPIGRAFKDMVTAGTSMMKPIIDAATEKFGPDAAAEIRKKLESSAGSMGGRGGMGGMDGGLFVKLTEKSNDGSTAVFDTGDGRELTFLKTSSGWRIDIAGSMKPEEAQMIEQMGSMMGMITAPMKAAAETIAAKIRAGELTADELPGALLEEMGKSMGGGFGGGGRRGGGRGGD